MKRESKIALLVGLAFIVCFGVILSGTRSETQTPAVGAVAVPVDAGGAPEARRPASLTALPALDRQPRAARPSITLDADPPRQSAQPRTPATAAAATAPTPARVVPPVDRTYTVRQGDSLSRIARREYGTDDREAYMRIFNANRDILRDPSSVRVGQVLRIPPPAATDADTDAAPPAPRTPDVRTYVVQPGDTLTRIARKTMNAADRRAVRRLYALNREALPDPDHLRIGQTLRIPR
ncbi:MAG: LysM peptidoglycan-binding domain-containing protein [Planctomycetota bacterium]